MNDKYDWIIKFYQNLQQSKFDYKAEVPPLCLASETRDKPVGVERSYRIEKKIFPKANLNRKNNFWEYGYYKSYDIEARIKSGHYKSKKRDELIERAVNAYIITDNKFLAEHKEMDYRVIILDSLEDYILHYLPKVMTNHDSKSRFLPTACMVLVRNDGSYFYALPCFRINWAKECYAPESLLNLNENILIDKEHEIPIITTDVATVLAVLDHTSITKAYIKNDTEDDTGQRVQMYSGQGVLSRIRCFDAHPVISYWVWKLTDDFPKTNNNDLGVLTDSELKYRLHEQQIDIERYLLHHISSHYDDNGEILYQITPTTSYWTQFFRHIGTQNLNEYFIRPKTSVATYPYINALTKKKLAAFTNQQVEDVPLKSPVLMKPLIKPHGLNQMFSIVQNGILHPNFIDHNKIVELYSNKNFDSDSYLEIRSFKLWKVPK